MRLSLTDVLLWPVERPDCARCQISMNLTVITPSSSSCERRLFECPQCGFIETKVATDPITSKEFAESITHRLAQGTPYRH
jgi:hypothetical protein